MKNATKEDRRKNRGVVLVEWMLKRKRDDEFGQNWHKARVAEEFYDLFMEAQTNEEEPIGDTEAICMLKKIEWKNGVPVAGRRKDEYVYTDGEVDRIGTGDDNERTGRHLGPDIFQEAIWNDIWAPRDDESPIMICGEEASPPVDRAAAVARMREAIVRVLNRVDVGIGKIEFRKQAGTEERLLNWYSRKISERTIYECVEFKSDWNIFTN